LTVYPRRDRVCADRTSQEGSALAANVNKEENADGPANNQLHSNNYQIVDILL
jgi:hypothetical protein